MQQEPSPNESQEKKSLPPVSPPSPAFILQLFLVPGILVALIVGFIWLFFGWIGTGPQTPGQFLAGLNSSSKLQRQKTAEQLAQVLKRNQDLAGNVSFALELARILKNTEVSQELEVGDENWVTEFLPAALATFNAPVGLPIFCETAVASSGTDPVSVLRRRGAVWAIALTGERLREFPALPENYRAGLLGALESSAGSTDTDSAPLAQAATDVLKAQKGGQQDPLAEWPTASSISIVRALEPCIRSQDEMTRKLTILALAMWVEPGVDRSLRELAGDNAGLTEFVDSDAARGRREVRYNATLALARRGSELTPRATLLEALNEQKQMEYYSNNPGPAARTVLAALSAVNEMKQSTPDVFEQDEELRLAVEQLTESENLKLQVEARRAISATDPATDPQDVLSRDLLWILGLSVGIAFFLAIAVIARWKRSPAKQPQIPA